MHTNYIYTFLVTKDGKKVITGSKDKKIKVWDWVKQKLINTLLFHEDTVESLVMTVDERLMFSGGLDGKVGIWAMNGFNLISHLISDFPIRTLTLTDDNDYLMAKEKPETRGAEG
jgi:WD40 repeat protein